VAAAARTAHPILLVEAMVLDLTQRNLEIARAAPQ
jgi:hypothetical protein